MIVPILQSILVLIGTQITWRMLKFFVAKDPLSDIPGPPAESWLTGSFGKLFDNNAWDYLKKVTDEYGSIFRVRGLFMANNLFVYDPKALHHIMIKDQDVYEETDDFIFTNTAVFGKSLISTLGDDHRRQRKMLTPAFSVAHMREMTPTFYSVVGKLRESLKQQVAHGDKEIDMLSWMTRTALELIGQSGYGYSFDTLQEDAVEQPFANSAKNYMRVIRNTGISFFRSMFLPYVFNIGSKNFQRAVVNILPLKDLHELRDIVDVMHETSVEIFTAAKRSVVEGDKLPSARIGGGKDIMSTLLKANMFASEEDKLSESELLAQISTLTFAAMDTTSNALSRILQVLSVYPDVQERLRQEICDAHKKHGDQLDYDTLCSLPFLDAVCRETMRLYSPAAVTTRQKDMVLPLYKPITTTDGRTLAEILVPKDTQIIVSMLYCNRNPDVWGADALEWKPDRWLSPLPDSVIKARVPGVYAHLMTFIAGSRACIGFKFSQLEMKVVLSLLLPALKFSPGSKEIEWQINGIIQPTVVAGTGYNKLQLPLKVGLV